MKNRLYLLENDHFTNLTQRVLLFVNAGEASHKPIGSHLPLPTKSIIASPIEIGRPLIGGGNIPVPIPVPKPILYKS